eukprot:1513442-Pyramimonas_sp.AAC.1
MSHWGPIFAARTTSDQDVQERLDRVFPQRPALEYAVPGEEELRQVAKQAGDSAPGPDGLPYRARLRSPEALSILASL